MTKDTPSVTDMISTASQQAFFDAMLKVQQDHMDALMKHMMDIYTSMSPNYASCTMDWTFDPGPPPPMPRYGGMAREYILSLEKE